jgi:hypothetical protein
MTQYAFVTRTAYIENSLPGEVRTFRLPMMMPGYFRASRATTRPSKTPAVQVSLGCAADEVVRLSTLN